MISAYAVAAIEFNELLTSEIMKRIYPIAAIILVLFIFGAVIIHNIKKTIKEKRSAIVWYNTLIDHHATVHNNIAEQYKEKINLANKYNDLQTAVRLQKLVCDAERSTANFERQQGILLEDIHAQKYHGSSYADMLNHFKLAESYLAELANIAMLLSSIHPANRTGQWNEEERNGETQYKSGKKTLEGSMFFSNCKTPEEITKKYRELAKIYHPDNTVTGNEDYFKKLKAEYDEYI